jgi:formylmethanofuran dehydrogenase subunit E
MKTYTIRRTITVSYDETQDFEAETEDEAIDLAKQSDSWDTVNHNPDDVEYDIEAVRCDECDEFPCEHLDYE